MVQDYKGYQRAPHDVYKVDARLTGFGCLLYPRRALLGHFHLMSISSRLNVRLLTKYSADYGHFKVSNPEAPLT